jgi:hypothetical protein
MTGGLALNDAWCESAAIWQCGHYRMCGLKPMQTGID